MKEKLLENLFCFGYDSKLYTEKKAFNDLAILTKQTHVHWRAVW